MEAIHKYPRTPHLAGSRLQPGDEDLAQVPLAELRGRYVVVEEKLDGANAGIAIGEDGRLRLQSRGHVLGGGPRERHFDLFKRWAGAHAAVLARVCDGGLTVYGEWLYAKHTIFYDALPHYFLEFDVRDPDGRFWSTARRAAHLAARGAGASIDWDAVEDVVGAVVGARALAATPQDAVFHAEGDVWLHTRMALEALCADPAWQAADAAARAITFAAVLLHDAGKPGSTRHEPDGRITSRGHSALGEHLVRAAFYEARVPFAWREHVCALVRWHQVPFFGIDRSAADAARLIARLSLVTRHDWLALVAAADGRGRRCADPRDQTRIVDNCTLWRELAAEQGALDRPRAFPDAHTRVVYLADESGTRHPDVTAYDDSAGDAFILSGLPASGKTTWLAAHPDLAAVSLDDLRAELDVDPADSQAPVVAAARERAREHLRAGRPFAWNATNVSRALRTKLVELCRAYRFRTHIVYCEAPYAEQQERNRARADAHAVPAAAIGHMLRRWTVPTPDEAHSVTYVLDPGPAPAWPPATP